MDRLRTLIVFICIVAFFVGAIYFTNKYDRFADQPDKVEVTVDTVIVFDTVYIDTPVYISKRVIDTFFLYVDSGKYVPLPIEQKEYKSEQYHAYVSGYRANLDSIQLYNKSEIVYIDRVNTVYKDKAGRKRWGIGLQAGYGINIYEPARASPYIGIGVSYNLLSF